MSNYPPGVTGNEPQIAGYPEGSRAVICAADDPYVVHLERAGDDIYSLVKDVLSTDQGLTASDIRRKIDALAATWRREGAVAPCTWEGVVDGVYSQGAFLWTCPNCGTEQEEDVSDD